MEKFFAWVVLAFLFTWVLLAYCAVSIMHISRMVKHLVDKEQAAERKQ